MGPCVRLFERLCTRNDFDQFTRNRCLPCSVVLEGQTLDQFFGVLGGVFHGAHPSRMLTRLVFQKRPEDLDLHRFRHQRGQQFLG